MKVLLFKETEEFKEGIRDLVSSLFNEQATAIAKELNGFLAYINGLESALTEAGCALTNLDPDDDHNWDRVWDQFIDPVKDIYLPGDWSEFRERVHDEFPPTHDPRDKKVRREIRNVIQRIGEDQK